MGAGAGPRAGPTAGAAGAAGAATEETLPTEQIVVKFTDGICHEIPILYCKLLVPCSVEKLLGGWEKGFV